MRVDAERVRHERMLRGWTQQHLAELADVSPRTIQRVENHGIASQESVSALSAAFDIERSALIELPQPRAAGKILPRRFFWLLVASAGAGATTGALLTWLLLVR